MKFNIKDEVQGVLGREMTGAEYRKYRQLRMCGFANPIDIARELVNA